MESSWQKQEVINTLERIKARIAAQIVAVGAQASGKTAKSMEVTETEQGGMLTGRQYFRSLEEGRPAGRVPYNFNAIIRQWILDKGLSVQPIQYVRKPSATWQPKYTPYERGLNAMAGAIAHTIATSGTVLYREGGRTNVYSEIIEEEVTKLGNILLLSYMNTISQTISDVSRSDNNQLF